MRRHRRRLPLDVGASLFRMYRPPLHMATALISSSSGTLSKKERKKDRTQRTA
jgi:hypothetical protein